jgi:GH15 family glucan-1,4-alpha-glucosidase
LPTHTPLGSEEVLEKEKQALEVIRACRTDQGFNASTQLYHQLWLRDLVYSEDSLLRLGFQRDVENHFSEFIALQRNTGQMPTVIDYGVSKVIRQRYQRCPSDAEILFVIGMNKLVAVGCDEFFDENLESVKLCVAFIENKLDSHRFIPGMDWRDAMPVYIDKYLLANQMLLADMYELQGNLQVSNLVKENVNKLFYCGDLGWYADSIHWSGNELKMDRHFDSLGNALAILNGTASKEASEDILRGFNVAKTPFGYRNIMPYYLINREKALATWYKTCRVPFAVFLRNRTGKYQNSAIWPFVEIRVIEALRKLQARNEADAATNIMIKRQGFNELYDPTTGAPEGSDGQLWTATAALEAINYSNNL